MEKPIQFTIVNEVPLESSGAFCATKVENKGESAITASPQMNKKEINTEDELANRNNGEIMQQIQDASNDSVAIFLVPKRCENKPPKTQANPPQAIIKNDNKGTLRLATEE